MINKPICCTHRKLREKKELCWTWTSLNYRRNLGHTYHLVKMRTGHPADIQTQPGAFWSFTVN